MSEYREHFIREIEIQNYKLFKDFSAKGFGRVNLIGGKNNVGKTAFIEACYLIQNSYKYKDKENRERYYLEILKLLFTIEELRKKSDFILDWIREDFEFYIKNFNIYIDKFKLECKDFYLTPIEMQPNRGWWNFGSFNINGYNKNKYFNEIYRKNSLPKIDNKKFISPYLNSNNLIKMIDDLKLQNRFDTIKKILQEVFNITNIDVIKNKVMLFDREYKDINEFGDGIKSYLSIILALISNKNDIIYIDEIENGIHYTNFDKLWEIILKISKEQNVQVFATTHSKECIESYARVAKKLEDKEIGFIELGINKKDELDSIVMNSEMFQRFIKLGNEVRGW